MADARKARRRPRPMRLRLHVAGRAPHSVAALANLQAILADHPAQPVELEVVDVLSSPEVAQADGVLVTPTLVRLAPGPTVRIVGDLALRASVVHALELASAP